MSAAGVYTELFTLQAAAYTGQYTATAPPTLRAVPVPSGSIDVASHRQRRNRR
jgi:hypothetical protein